MRNSLALTATVLALAWAAPASAMCGGSPSTTGTTASTSGGGMMCGMGQRAAATDPMSETRSPSQQGAQAGMGCPCCRNMAMMQGGGMSGMMGGGQQQQGAQPSQPSSPAQPSMPDMPGMTPRQQ
jgi:hypothetical protein